MSQIIKELPISCADTGFLKVSTSPLDYPELSKLSNESFDLSFDQGFILHSNYVAFVVPNNSDCYVRIVLSEAINVELTSTIAIVVPYYVPDKIGLYVSSDEPGERFEITGGDYQLLYQLRPLKDEEVASLMGYTKEHFDPDVDGDNYRPSLCTLTFISSDTEKKPSILKQDSLMNPPSELVLTDD